MKMAKVVSQSIHAKVANGMALDVPSSPPKKNEQNKRENQYEIADAGEIAA